MSKGKIISGVVAGMAAGAVLAILFAPDKGTETRRKIAKGGTDFKDSIKSKLNSMVDDVMDEYENVKTKAGNLLTKGKEKAAPLASATQQKEGLWKQDTDHIHS